MKKGAIILCGGKSTRMGRDKATLPFGPELMLPRMIRLLSEVVEQDSIVVVASRGQRLPRIPAGVNVTHDHHQGRGPLEGISAGMSSLHNDVETAYVTSCDVPLLVPAFVGFMFDRLENHEIAVPCEDNQYHPLSAVYRRSVQPLVQQLLSFDRLRVQFLFDEADTRIVTMNELRDVDPQLQTLINLNHLDDYHAALQIAGFTTE